MKCIPSSYIRQWPSSTCAMEGSTALRAGRQEEEPTVQKKRDSSPVHQLKTYTFDAECVADTQKRYVPQGEQGCPQRTSTSTFAHLPSPPPPIPN